MSTTAPPPALDASAITSSISGMSGELGVVAAAGLAIGAGVLVVRRGWGLVKGLAK